ncbi:creatininase family protein [Streptomyces sp. ISL-43]|uniref:creatininase family protein n=1 Tax=Streptomyces sp. ISL-43 TaxID=2819183 RepID=UPI001BE829FC|nr:creatininase family protein [Streptomyces sp. ISL-43]
MHSGSSVFAGTMADLTYPQVEAAAAAGTCVLLPTGVIEQHGPHLPLGTDAYGAYQLCRMVKDELDRHQVPALIAPPVFWGINQVSGAFAGRPVPVALLPAHGPRHGHYREPLAHRPSRGRAGVAAPLAGRGPAGAVTCASTSARCGCP